MKIKIKLKKMKFKLSNCALFIILTVINFCVCSENLSNENNELLLNNDENLQRNHNHHKFNDIPKWINEEDFILIDYLTDGELEKRISYKGIAAKETTLDFDSSKSLSLWQISNGYGFIQLIYSSFDELIDCEYIHQENLVNDFLKKFYMEIDNAKLHNFTTGTIPKNHQSIITNHEFRRYIDDNIIPEDYYDLQETTPTDYQFGMRNLTFIKLRDFNDIPNDLRPFLNYNHLKKKCHERHSFMKKLVQELNSNDENVKRNATEHFERKKRDLSDWMIAPNTKWCGKGHKAGSYNQLGGASRADKCCRKHDHCRLTMPGLSTKWHLFNFFPYTLSHCQCDRRFRTCLKMADSSDANMVGKLFFNIMQTKCFVLKPEKVCKKRSWWGKCEKKELRKRAHVRDNRQF